MKMIFLLMLFLVTTNSFGNESSNRIKDLVSIKGVRDNPLIGYGLVIGLNGTGDSGGEITNTSLKKMFQTLGFDPKADVASANVAAVIVTANLPPFARVGQKIDITISSIGDASSLAGGTLMVTPLKGGDGKIYSVASGPISIGGLKQGAKFATTAKIPSGGTVEQEINLDFNKKQAIRLALKNPDFTTAARLEKTINQELGGKFADAKDSATIDLVVPPNYQRNVVELIAILENFKVISDTAAKIVINERTGTIVAGGEITLKKSAISHGDMVIEVNDGSSPTGRKSVHLLEQTSTISDLVKVLNAIGTTPEDLISIFQTLKKNGVLVAELELI
ncbi:MAG: flagellar basal body P-ring protein FlgI [Bacteriovoracaceae bacterium]|nr:flagellar basal body P-ring protein FlgI [Bacteriovoracaceae bacterium]